MDNSHFFLIRILRRLYARLVDFLPKIAEGTHKQKPSNTAPKLTKEQIEQKILKQDAAVKELFERVDKEYESLPDKLFFFKLGIRHYAFPSSIGLKSIDMYNVFSSYSAEELDKYMVSAGRLLGTMIAQNVYAGRASHDAALMELRRTHPGFSERVYQQALHESLTALR